jgi:hypothetical protein
MNVINAAAMDVPYFFYQTIKLQLSCFSLFHQTEEQIIQLKKLMQYYDTNWCGMANDYSIHVQAGNVQPTSMLLSQDKGC